MSRSRQLNEEKKQFSLLMKKKLSPRFIVKEESSICMERTLRSVNVSPLASSESSWKSFESKPRAKGNASFPTIVGKGRPPARKPKVDTVSLAPRRNGSVPVNAAPPCLILFLSGPVLRCGCGFVVVDFC